MIKNLIFLLILIFSLLYSGGSIYAESNTAKEETTKETTTKETKEEIKKEEIEVLAQGAILMEMESGRVLWEKESRKKMAMASTTKIMTAIVALENGNMSDTVTVSSRAAVAPRVKMGLTKDETISLEGLIYALMLQSSNDAAVAIAEHVGGSVENFCNMMTDKAASIGATDTTFVTPNGLDAENHQSTAYDLALIARYALKNQTFVGIINTPTYNLTSSKRTYGIYNKNRLLNEYDGAFGVKTGYTGQAGHCFVGAAERNGLKMISVVLASGWGEKGKAQKWIDTKQILNYAFKNYNWEVVVSEGDEVGKINVGRSKTEKIPLYFSDNIKLPLSEEEKTSISISLDIPDKILAPVKKDDIIGIARIYSGETFLAETNILSGVDIERHDLKTSLEKFLNEFIEMGTRGNIEICLPELEIFNLDF